ncbi:MAG: hypothetical protein HOP27_11440 [Anaerolineales bacterium]|nr:hypothetical protein [Anaerolineales bacterium]
MSKMSLRYKDVLFALSAAKSHQQLLGRLQLQKYIYLADTLSLLWEVMNINGYETYKRGPYDPNIQNAVDVLAFRGFVLIKDSKYSSDGNVAVNYEISILGEEIVSKLILEEIFLRKYQLFYLLSEYIEERGWGKLLDLVYSEATYLTGRVAGYGHALKLNSLLSNETIQILFGFNTLTRDRNVKFSRENLLSIFFQILDNYHALHMGVG